MKRRVNTHPSNKCLKMKKSSAPTIPVIPNGFKVLELLFETLIIERISDGSQFVWIKDGENEFFVSRYSISKTSDEKLHSIEGIASAKERDPKELVRICKDFLKDDEFESHLLTEVELQSIKKWKKTQWKSLKFGISKILDMKTESYEWIQGENGEVDINVNKINICTCDYAPSRNYIFPSNIFDYIGFHIVLKVK